jgi:uncharacterized protein (TIGR02421 family)
MGAAIDKGLEAIRRAAPMFERVAKDTRLLDALQWSRAVEEKFFAAKGKELPQPEYEVDRDRATNHAIALDELAMTLDVGDPIQRWVTQVARSYADGNRLLLAIGTPRFHAMSVDVYGGPRSWFDADSTNLDLANHLAERLEGELASAASDDQHEKKLDCEAFAKSIKKKSESIGLEVDVQIDDEISAKVLAGMTRVRVRSGATFRKLEVEGLFVHEVETHALTAQNGAAQPELPFLRSGGPRTTRTQEGLAVFSEFYSHALLIERMKRIVQRVRLIAAAEDGADFLDLYQRLLETGCTERDAYFDAQRICRGGLVEGRAPFTKDASYLAGFTEVFNFLQVAVRGGARDAVETLACGRIAIDDLAILVELKRRGVLRPAKYTPRWLDNWDALLPFFAFASFLQEIDLKQVEKRHREVIAASTTPIE